MKSSSSNRNAPAPEGLSEKSRGLWVEFTRKDSTKGRQALIEQALRALDRADEAAAGITEHGLISTTKTTGVVHVNPLVKVERESRQLFTKLMVQLSLHWRDDD